MTEQRPESTAQFADGALALERFAELDALLSLVSEIAGGVPSPAADLEQFEARYARLNGIARVRFDVEARAASEYAAAGVSALLIAGLNAPGRSEAAAELARALTASFCRMEDQLG